MERVFIRLQWIIVACLVLLLGVGAVALWTWLWFNHPAWARTFAVAFVFVVAFCAGTFVASILLAFSAKSRPLCGDNAGDDDEENQRLIQ